MDTTIESHQVMHAFEVRPEIRFDSQLAGEKILLVVRSHPVTLLPWIINAVFLTILLLLLNFLFPIVLTPIQSIFTNILAAALLFAYIWYNFLLWYFNVGIVTDQRVLDVKFATILYKEVVATRLEKVEEVTDKSAGYLSSLFDFGNVFVETASSEINIEFIKVPHPSEIVQLINNLSAEKK